MLFVCACFVFVCMRECVSACVCVFLKSPHICILCKFVVYVCEYNQQITTRFNVEED